MTLVEQIDKDLVTAMKNQEALRLSVLRMTKSALKLKQVELGKPVGDEAARAVLRTLVKQRKEAAELFREGGRAELADKEMAEIGILEAYLPAAVTEAEMDAAVVAAFAETGAASPKDLGKVMKVAMARLAGRTVDGKRLSEIARVKLDTGD
ncbi:MAG: GatB/YqeY domain-containing protein [Terriglobia bacterium]